MTSFYGMAAAMLAASQMAEASLFYPDVLGAERRRNTPKTINIKRGYVPYLGNVDLLGKSHGKGASKRKARRATRTASEE